MDDLTFLSIVMLSLMIIPAVIMSEMLADSFQLFDVLYSMVMGIIVVIISLKIASKTRPLRQSLKEGAQTWIIEIDGYLYFMVIPDRDYDDINEMAPVTVFDQEDMDSFETERSLLKISQGDNIIRIVRRDDDIANQMVSKKI